MTDFLPENDLERALMEAAADPASLGKFYSLLLDSQLFVLGRAQEGKIEIAQIHHHDRLYHPIFSAPIRMQHYAQDHPRYFSMRGRELFANARDAYFLLNPGWAYAKELIPQELARLLQLGNATAQPTGEILITQPAVFPVILADALRKLFATRPEVEAAYLAQMATAGQSDSPHPIVGVKLDGPWEPLALEIGRVVAPLPQGTRLAAIAIAEDRSGKALGDALMRYEPIYLRKSSLH
jgi:hypothetical protein